MDSNQAATLPSRPLNLLDRLFSSSLQQNMLSWVQAELNLTSEQKLGVIAARDEYLQVLDLLQLKQVRALPFAIWCPGYS